MIEFGILGPLEVVVDGERIMVGGAKVRTLLAVLLVHANHVVSADRLADALWPESPPMGAMGTLRSHLSHLRRVMDRGTPSGTEGLLVSRPPGYVLTVQPEAIDAGRFEALVSTAHQARVSGQAERAAATFRQALALWRGPALAEFVDATFSRTESVRLEELRLTAIEERTEADLTLGRHAELVGELGQLVTEHPLRERLWGQLMVALYRCGRQGDALRAFARLRRTLVEELGIEPGPELELLEEAVLLRKPEIEWRASPCTPPPTNLPRELSSFVGRDEELTALNRALVDTRLLCLVGSGGVGKTRLGLRLAEHVVKDYPDGVFLVEMAPLSDAGLVPHQVLTALPVAEEPGRDPLDTVARWLGHRRVLLVLDNCEHVASGCAALVEALLRSSADLQILAISREPLGVAGEAVWRVPSLQRQHAVRLFCERARAARSDFCLTPAQSATVEQICDRLECIPLAIELAAARMNVLGCAEIAARLDDRWRLLAAGARRAVPRHRTLRAAIDWSYDLLDTDERALFRRLAVFAGGFCLAAVEAVCGDDSAEASMLLDNLSHLVDKSLVVAAEQDGVTRYRLLEMLRQYGWERLVEGGEVAEIRSRHLAWCQSFVQEAGERWSDLDREHDNLRRALRLALEDAPTDAGLGLAVALSPFWFRKTHVSEGRSWLEKMLAASLSASASLRGEAIVGAAVLANYQGDVNEGSSLAEEGLAAVSGPTRAECLFLLGNIAAKKGEDEAARSYYEASLSQWSACGTPRGRFYSSAWAHAGLGGLHYAGRKLEAARSEYRRALQIPGALDDCLEPIVFGALATVAQEDGDEAGARDLLETALRKAERSGGELAIPDLSTQHVALELAWGDFEKAAALSREGLVVFADRGQVGQVVLYLGFLARAAIAQGCFERAGRLLAAVSRLRAQLGSVPRQVQRDQEERDWALVGAQLGDRAAAVCEEGAAMSLEEAIAYGVALGRSEAALASAADAGARQSSLSRAPETVR